MRYRQTHVSRFSAAAERLASDGAWHAFTHEARAWYRVHGRVLQQVRLEDGEEEDLIRLFDAIAPMPSKLLRGGYRQELAISRRDDRFVLGGVLLRAYPGWEMLAAAAADFGCEMLSAGGDAVACEIAVDPWSGGELHRSVAVASAVAVIAAQLREDEGLHIPHARGEVARLLTTAYAVMLEQSPPPDAAPAGGHAEQTTLFPRM